MLSLISGVILSGAVALGGGSVAIPNIPAQTGNAVERSGNIFHVAVCPQRIAPRTASCHAHVVTDIRGNVIVKNAATATPSGYSSSQLRSAYNITTSGSSSTVVAIVDAYGYPNAGADLAVYRAQMGLPACGTGCFTKVNESGVQGSYPAFNGGWATETALDLDMVSTMCPSCKILLVEGNTPSFVDLATSVNTAAAMGAHVISNSYGGGEEGSQSYESAYNHAGVAITASTGDSGFAAGPQFPATSPHVIAVGGTTLIRSSTKRGWSETAWDSGGSGCSTVYAKPAWQKDTKCTKRMEADVAAIADPYTGVAVYAPVSATSSAWEVYGGTSVAAPLTGGVYGNNGGATLVYYGSNPYNAAAGALNDVTAGSNGVCGGTYFCNAEVGYDGPTGLGTPNGISAY